jgi:hypothetical protein
MILLLILAAVLVLMVGVAIGFGVAVILAGGWLVLLVGIVGSASLLAGASMCFRDANAAGDGGLADALVGCMLVLVVIGAWAGFGLWWLQ